MQPWWWRSVAVCASVLALSGLVAVVAGAVGADQATSLRLAAEDVASAPSGPPPAAEGSEEPEEPAASEEPAEPPVGPGEAPAPDEPRVPDAVTATTLALPAGWRVVPDQDVVEVPPGRFVDATILRRGAGTVVLVGLADPERVPVDPPVADPARSAALDAEARRLADAYADLLAPGATTADLTDDDVPVADLPTRTSVRRVEGGELDGALVRVSTIAAPGRTLAVLAVARPSPTVGADGEAADAVVRSLRVDPA
ncbi:hypothetical protein [Actinomycetospora lemnae]|uniref:SAF domain-containing protein n=1 Tax=Actinomycetospora lemnae TaxID=3019891 RepID=A0ABT5SLW0_9PSEU|nr:hypothetical protein [Actinomycetospora sp. DW7H6]MDD7963823.1 hypothetical protein [Actinomycetospora sp. DW7H6]